MIGDFMIIAKSNTVKNLRIQIVALVMMVVSSGGCYAEGANKVSVPVEVWRDASTNNITIIGIAKTKDGDTIAIDGVFDVRLFGIDAVEKRQTCSIGKEIWHCGAEAKAFLAELVDNQKVICENRKKEKYGRYLAVCKVGDIVLNEEMVRRGYAVSYLAPDYVDAEEQARIDKVGIWAGEFLPPAQFRKH